MTIAEQLLLIQSTLNTWAKANGAQARIAADPASLMAFILTARPGSVNAYVTIDREEPVHDVNDMVERTFLIVLSQGRGFQQEPADSLVLSSAQGPALYDLAESCREVLRDIEFEPYAGEGHEACAEEVRPCYKGARPWRGADRLPVDAQELEIRIFTQLPPPGEPISPELEEDPTA